jgi:hypothetical protein
MLRKFTGLSRPLLFALGTLASATTALAGGLPCDRIEYAQLKDSSRKELIDAHCRAIGRADLNASLLEIKRESRDKLAALGRHSSESVREIEELSKDRMSCLKVSESALAMLEKKYSAKAPKSCN